MKIGKGCMLSLTVYPVLVQTDKPTSRGSGVYIMELVFIQIFQN